MGLIEGRLSGQRGKQMPDLSFSHFDPATELASGSDGLWPFVPETLQRFLMLSKIPDRLCQRSAYTAQRIEMSYEDLL